MRFEQDRSTLRATTRDRTPLLVVIVALLGVGWCLLVDVASVELVCHGGRCVLTRRSLAHHSGFFGRLRGSFQLLFPPGTDRRSFDVSALREVRTKEVRGKRSSHYDLYLVLREGNNGASAASREEEEEEIFWDSFPYYDSLGRARDAALHLEGAIKHAQLPPPRSPGRTSSSAPSSSADAPLPIHARVDRASWDEALLVVFLIVLGYTVSVSNYSEVVVINRECGVVAVEHRTLLSLIRSAARSRWHTLPFVGGSGGGGGGGGGNPSSHVALLAPVSLVTEVEETHKLDRRDRRSVDSWGMRLKLRDRPPLPLRLGMMTTDRWSNGANMDRLRSALRLAGDDLDARTRSRLEGRVESAEGLRSAASASAYGGNLASGRQGGGEPGGRCVVCLEKTARVAFAPCAHVCCCEDCGQNPALSTCPICRGPIAHRIGLYFSS